MTKFCNTKAHNINKIYNCRRKHKKGQEEEQSKKRTRRTQKYQRAIVGASLTDILAKRNVKPEIRKAQREQAIKYVLFIFSKFNFLKVLLDICSSDFWLMKFDFRMS